jgi:hypothetical protein
MTNTYFKIIYPSSFVNICKNAGNFSFSLSLLRGLGAPYNLTATSYETYESLLVAYPDAKENIEILKDAGVTVLHGIDATKLHTYPTLVNKGFDVIAWNFPCVASKEGADAQDYDIEINKVLIKSFLSNSPPLLSPNGSIHITHKTKAPFGEWGVVDIGKSVGLNFGGAIVFDKSMYPEYINKKALTKDSFPSCDSLHYIFMKSLTCSIFPVQVHRKKGKAPTTLGPIPLDMVREDKMKVENAKAKKHVFASVEKKGKASKKRKRVANREDREIYEDGFEYDDGTESEGQEELEEEAANTVMPEWNMLEVHAPYKLIQVSRDVLRAVRMSLLDKPKMAATNLELKDQEKVLGDMNAWRSVRLAHTWDTALFGPKRKRQKKGNEGGGVSSKNAFAALVVDESSSDDDL